MGWAIFQGVCKGGGLGLPQSELGVLFCWKESTYFQLHISFMVLLHSRQIPGDLFKCDFFYLFYIIHTERVSNFHAECFNCR